MGSTGRTHILNGHDSDHRPMSLRPIQYLLIGGPAGPPIRDGCVDMPYRDGWRDGERGRETPCHLTADRLADILGALPSEPSDSVTTRPFPGASPRTLGAPPHPCGARSGELDRSGSVAPLPTVWQSVVEPPAVSKGSGRHRRRPSARFRVWGFAFTSRRLVLIGVLALLVGASATLLVLA
jgi:hypothetical protein